MTTHPKISKLKAEHSKPVDNTPKQHRVIATNEYKPEEMHRDTLYQPRKVRCKSTLLKYLNRAFLNL